MTRPASMQTSRSTARTRMWTMCSIQTMAMPCSRSRWMVTSSSSASASVRPPPISSSSSTSGPVASARASSSRLRWSSPRLRAAVRHGSRPGQLEHREAAVVCGRAAQPAAGRRADVDVLEDGHAHERPRHLVGPSDAHGAALRRPALGDVDAPEPDRPRGRLLRAGQDVEQRGLAGTVGPDDADGAAGLDREVHVVEDHETPIPLVDGASRQDRFAVPRWRRSHGARQGLRIRQQLRRDGHVRVSRVLAEHEVEREAARSP